MSVLSVIGAIIVGIIIIGIIVAIAKRRKKPAKQVINPPSQSPRSGGTTIQLICANDHCSRTLPKRKRTDTSMKCPYCGHENNF